MVGGLSRVGSFQSAPRIGYNPYEVSMSQKPVLTTVPLSQVGQGPIRHTRAAFEGERTTYIRRIMEVFQEVMPDTLEGWIDGFRRDMNPNKEIALWTVMADIFEEVLASRDTTLGWRKELHVLLLQATFKRPEEVAREWTGAQLDRQEAAMILSKLPNGGRVSGAYGIGLPKLPEG